MLRFVKFDGGYNEILTDYEMLDLDMFYVFMLSETANRGHYWTYIGQVSSNGKLGLYSQNILCNS